MKTHSVCGQNFSTSLVSSANTNKSNRLKMCLYNDENRNIYVRPCLGRCPMIPIIITLSASLSALNSEGLLPINFLLHTQMKSYLHQYVLES